MIILEEVSFPQGHFKVNCLPQLTLLDGVVCPSFELWRPALHADNAGFVALVGVGADDGRQLRGLPAWLLSAAECGSRCEESLRQVQLCHPRFDGRLHLQRRLDAAQGEYSSGPIEVKRVSNLV